MAGRSENGRTAEPERTTTMKKILIALAVLALAGSAYAAQKSDATIKDVRNPRVLATIINANAADAESRLTSGSTTASNLTLIGSADVTNVTIVDENGTVVIDDGTLTASDDLVSTDDITVGDDLTVTDDAAVGGDLAVTGAATVTETLAVTGNTTLNGTLTMSTNKFTVSTAGAVVAASTVTMASPVFTAEAVAAPTNSASAGFAVTVNGTNYWMALYPVNN